MPIKSTVLKPPRWIYWSGLAALLLLAGLIAACGEQQPAPTPQPPVPAAAPPTAAPIETATPGLPPPPLPAPTASLPPPTSVPTPIPATPSATPEPTRVPVDWPDGLSNTRVIDYDREPHFYAVQRRLTHHHNQRPVQQTWSQQPSCGATCSISSLLPSRTA